MTELTDKLTKEFMDKDYAHAYMDSHQSTRIASQIKALREQRNLTQEELADLCSMKQERISALEDINYDSWTLSTLRKLAYTFDTSLQVSFIPFSQAIGDIASFSRKHLEVESREKDLKSFSKGNFFNTDLTKKLSAIKKNNSWTKDSFSNEIRCFPLELKAYTYKTAANDDSCTYDS